MAKTSTNGIRYFAESGVRRKGQRRHRGTRYYFHVDNNRANPGPCSALELEGSHLCSVLPGRARAPVRERGADLTSARERIRGGRCSDSAAVATARDLSAALISIGSGSERAACAHLCSPPGTTLYPAGRH